MLFSAVNYPFQKIGLAIAFSPTARAMLMEANRLCRLFACPLILVHVGPHGSEEEKKINDLIAAAAVSVSYKIRWCQGKVERELLRACHDEQIDLLIAGALKREKMVKYYVGTIARAIMRKARCSVLMIHTPSVSPQPFQQIVINAENSPLIERALRVGCQLAKIENASWVHIVRELKLLGLTMSAHSQLSESEYSLYKQGLLRDEFQVVEKILEKIPHAGTKVNVKILSGKSGFELCKFVEKKKADLLVVGAPPQQSSWLDRFFPHDLEYVFADLPCHLLVVNNQYQNHG
ncbi:MAG: universal stress protein [Bacteroidetes bacterium]|nr:universal stress protein [Bacteroidota bacterium]